MNSKTERLYRNISCYSIVIVRPVIVHIKQWSRKMFDIGGAEFFR